MINIGNLLFFVLHPLRSLGLIVDIILNQFAEDVEAYWYLAIFFVAGMPNCLPIRTNHNRFIKTRFHLSYWKLDLFTWYFPLSISDYSCAREIIAQGYRWRSGWGPCWWHDQTDISEWTRCSLQSEEKICIEWDICKWFIGAVLFTMVIFIWT